MVVDQVDAAGEDTRANVPSRQAFSSQRDTVQLVEIRNPEGTGWSAMSKAVREYDEEEIGYYKDDIDTLLVFAGLYSAVLSAFIIESYTFLQPDTKDTMVFLFQHMLAQNYSMSNGFLNATNPYPPMPDFVAPTWAIRVNVLWFASLVVSLAAASYGMLVKQWLREYLNTSGTTSPRERLRARQYRRPALDRWMVFEIAASLPLLLEIALGLFFVGLCYFTSAIHSSISRATVPLVVAWAFFFLVATVAPLVSPRCPFKTTILRAVLRQGRKVVLMLAGSALLLYLTLMRAYFLKYTIADAGRFCHIVIRAYATALHEQFPSHLGDLIPTSIRITLPKIYLPHLSDFGTSKDIQSLLENLETRMEEEKVVLTKKQDDIAILRSVDEIMPGDGLLPTLVDVASAAKPPWREAFALMKTIIDNRTGRDMNLDDPSTWNDSLQLLSQQSCDALTAWVSDILLRHQTAKILYSWEFSQCAGLFCSLVSSHSRPLSEPREATLYDVIFHMKISFPPCLFRSHTFTNRLAKLFADLNSDKGRVSLTHAECAFGAENLILRCDCLVDSNGNIRGFEGRWISNALDLLISLWTAPSPHGQPKKHRPTHPLPNRLIEKIISELCRIERRGRIFGIRRRGHIPGMLQVDIFYGILLGGAMSECSEWQYPSELFARNLTSICMLVNWEVYHPGEDGPTSPRRAFLTLMKSHSEDWMTTLLGWLAPGRMPGNILAEIVAADLAACEPDEQRRKMDDIVYICRIASLEKPHPDPINGRIDFSTLLQIIILLQRYGVLDKEVLEEKTQAVQTAFRTAVVCRHGAYKTLIKLRVARSEYGEVSNILSRMHPERLDMVYAIGHGCYRQSGWAGSIRQEDRARLMWWLETPRIVAARLRFLVEDSWAQQEQLKAKPQIPGQSSRPSLPPIGSDDSSSGDDG